MKILLYGSAYLTELVEARLHGEGHTIVGHIPCHNPRFPGQMQSPVVNEDTPHDIRLSVLYDRLIKKIDNGYNIHPGLLPRWAGCDILYHLVAENSKYQGITFHKLSDKFDQGEIVRTTTWTIPRVSIVGLFGQLCWRLPEFAADCINEMAMGEMEPVYYHRGLIDRKELFEKGGRDIASYIEADRAARKGYAS